MKLLLITTIAAVVLVGCGESQQSTPAPESNPVEPVTETAKKEPPTAKAPDMKWSIHGAARFGDIEEVKQHLAAGTDVNEKADKIGVTPLHFASGEGHMEVAELLIAKGADVNAKSDDGRTPLISARTKEIAELLIAKGADVDAKDNDGWTPLHNAVVNRPKEVTELLIAKGSDVNAKEQNGRIPLDWAIRQKHAEIAALLRKHGGKTGEELEAEGK